MSIPHDVFVLTSNIKDSRNTIKKGGNEEGGGDRENEHARERVGFRHEKAH